MNDPGIPKFGRQIPGVHYQPRPGAYGVLTGQDGQLAVIRTPSGDHLPGGGSLPGETAEQTLRREGREEAGLELGELTKIGAAWEYVYARAEGAYFCKHGIFFFGKVGATDHGRQEAGHELVWLAPEGALETLAHGSQRWAVKMYLANMDAWG